MVDAGVAQQIERLLVFDAFGDGLQAEAAHEADDGMDDVLVGHACDGIADELAFDPTGCAERTARVLDSAPARKAAVRRRGR